SLSLPRSDTVGRLLLAATFSGTDDRSAVLAGSCGLAARSFSPDGEGASVAESCAGNGPEELRQPWNVRDRHLHCVDHGLAGGDRVDRVAVQLVDVGVRCAGVDAFLIHGAGVEGNRGA